MLDSNLLSYETKTTFKNCLFCVKALRFCHAYTHYYVCHFLMLPNMSDISGSWCYTFIHSKTQHHAVNFIIDTRNPQAVKEI